MENPRLDKKIQFYKGRKQNVEKIENVNVWLEINQSETKWKFTVSPENKDTFTVSGESSETDENRLFLISLIETLEWIKNTNKKNVVIYVNNTYVINCISEWIVKWERNNFFIDSNDGSTKNKKERPNADLLRKISELKTMCFLTLKCNHEE